MCVNVCVSVISACVCTYICVCVLVFLSVSESISEREMRGRSCISKCNGPDCHACVSHFFDLRCEEAEGKK